MYLQNAEIQNFRGIRHLKVDFEQDTTVMIGENAWGKSSLLYALFMILGRGEDHLCSFSAEDLYIPIRLDADQESTGEVESGHIATLDSTGSSSSTALLTASVATGTATAGTAAATSAAPVIKPVPQNNSEVFAQAAQSSVSSHPSMNQAAAAHLKESSFYKFLQEQGLAELEPLKIITTKNYQRRYYRVPKGDGTYIIHIIDLPTNIEAVQDSLKEAIKSQHQALSKGNGSKRKTAPAPKSRPQQYIDALASFLAPQQQQLITPDPRFHNHLHVGVPLSSKDPAGATTDGSLVSSNGLFGSKIVSEDKDKTAGFTAKSAAVISQSGTTTTTTTTASTMATQTANGSSAGVKQSSLEQKLKGREALFEALRRGQAAEAQYERDHPLHYVPSRSELMQRAQNVLQGREHLEQEAIASAQEDVAFYQSDVFTSKVERIVIDLIFCESAYGVVNKVERFASLKPACYLGEDGLYRIHYRISAAMQMQPNGPDGQVGQGGQGGSAAPKFVTTHELLNARGEPIENAQSIIRELIILNPLLRLRDRRMLKPHLDPQESLMQEPSCQIFTTVEQVQAATKAAQEAVASSSSFSASTAASAAEGDAKEPTQEGKQGSAQGANHDDSHAFAGHHGQVDERDMQAISHFFTDIALDDDFTSRQIKDGIEVLNTIASKYLINYQSNNLSTAYEFATNGSQKRTVRDIISHPISLGSLRSLQAALSDNKPSRAKFLLALLAGALLMSRGQREIDEYSRPILILEDIESRFHPTLLLNLWAILQLLPIQKIVTTNSAQLLSAVPMSKLRRLCKQYYDVRCYSMRDRAFSEDDARKIAFHIRMKSPSTLFARCWILVEGETEVWVLNEIANALDFNLSCSGVAIVEFAQCGLNPLIKLAKQLGIAYHVLTDGDDAGRHYAQIVCDFVGNHNLPEHLSVMPHVDIEHYLYSAGFADVYQKAAGLTLNTPKYKFVHGALQNMGLSERDASFWASPRNKLDRVICSSPASSSAVATASASAVATASDSVATRNSSSTALQDASVAGAGKNKGKGKISGKAAAAAAAAALKAKGIKAKKGDKQDPIHINARDYELKTHSLDSVVKTILHYNLGNHREALTKAINRGRIQGQSKKSQLLDIKEVSRGDVNNFYQYTHNLIMSMPRPHQNLTKRQSQILNFLKSERALWLEVVNHNQQRLNKQLRQAQAAAKIAAEQQYAEQLKSMQDKLAAGEGADSAAAAAAAATTEAVAATAVTAVAETAVAQEHVAAQSKDKSDTREHGGSPCGCKEAMAKAQLPEGRAERERLNGQNANDFYGALSPKELSKQGFSMSKVIDKAMHKKTKPVMAILVSEAILQRGAASVPQLFSTLFCKVKRLAQSELPFD